MFKSLQPVEAEYPEELMDICRKSPFRMCSLQYEEGVEKVIPVKGSRSGLKALGVSGSTMQDICMVRYFTFSEETKTGRVDALLNLVDEASCVRMSGTLYDVRNHRIIGDLPDKLEQTNRQILELDQQFYIEQPVDAADLAIIIKSNWITKAGDEMYMVTEHENVEGYLDYSYKHSYPAKESRTVELEIKDGNWAEPITQTKQTGNQDNIVICFNRTPGYRSDVDYKLMVKEVGGHPVFAVPGKGRLGANGAVVVLDDPAYAPTAVCCVTKTGGGGGVLEQYTVDYPDKVFDKDGNDLVYEMLLSWNQTFLSPGGQSANLFDYDLTLHAWFQEKTAVAPRPATLRVTSFDVPDTGNEVLCRIQKLQIMWGCLCEGSRVRMADGSMRRIEEIRIGELTGRDHAYGRVINCWSGQEEVLYNLITEDGNSIKLTNNHPVLTERGLMGAAFIRKGTRIMTENGSFAEITAVKELHGCFKVCNLELDSEDHLFCAEGFTVGDFQLQNNYNM